MRVGGTRRDANPGSVTRPIDPHAPGAGSALLVTSERLGWFSSPAHPDRAGDAEKGIPKKERRWPTRDAVSLDGLFLANPLMPYERASVGDRMLLRAP